LSVLDTEPQEAFELANKLLFTHFG